MTDTDNPGARMLAALRGFSGNDDEKAEAHDPMTPAEQAEWLRGATDAYLTKHTFTVGQLITLKAAVQGCPFKRPVVGQPCTVVRLIEPPVELARMEGETFGERSMLLNGVIALRINQEFYMMVIDLGYFEPWVAA